jgi:hypothetical protein
LFLLYLPAPQSGWVSDTLGWLDAVRHQSFWDFVSRKGFGVRSFYQLTQIVTWCLYQAFGSNPWAWHLLHLSLHALNATLLFTFLKRLVKDSGIEQVSFIAFAPSALFCCSPYVSEVIVWEASFHFLQGLLFILLQLHLLQRFLHTGQPRDAILAIILFSLSLFSLELYYIVPLLSLSLCLYYRLGLGWQKERTGKAMICFVAPQILALGLSLIAVRLFYHVSVGRLGNSLTEFPITYYLVKPPENLFHLLGGRFLLADWRALAYHMCSSSVGAGLFYLSLAAMLFYILFRFRQLQPKGKLLSFFFIWLLLGIGLVSPLWFPEKFLITGDRYLYVLLPPFFSLIVLGLMRIGLSLGLQRLVLLVLVAVQCSLTLMLNNVWAKSTELTNQLQLKLTGSPDKVTILLNSPASLCGAAMIGAGMDDEALLMHNLLYPTQITSPIRDAPAMHMLSESDSVKIEVLDPQTIRVSLLQPGSFWQYGSDVARSYANTEFSFRVDENHRAYTLELISHPSTYRLLYQQAGEWHELRFTDY